MGQITNEILNSNKRNHIVISAAGSGKTSLLLDILVNRIKRQDINPYDEEVIVFTFTNDAADELAVRLTKIFENQQNLLNQIFIGTIHGWCNTFLQKGGTLSNTKIIDELEQSQLILRIYPILNITEAYDEANKFRKIESFIKDLELFYNENLDIDDSIIPEKVRICINNYIEFIRTQRLLDFGSLIRESILQLENLNSDRKLHVFVDEYQDVNLAQVELIKNILNLHPESTLFAVGDPRQAIYQWRGSDIRRILNYSSDFKDTETFTMKNNYRSRTGILEFANAIAKDMDFSSYVESTFEIEDMIPVRADEKISLVHETGDFPHEEIVVKRIMELSKNGVKYSDIAILMRSVIYHSEYLMELLDKYEVPYYSPNKNAGINFIQNFMGSIIRLMEFMSDDYEPANRAEKEDIEKEIDLCLEHILNYCSDIIKADIHLAVAEWHNKLTTLVGKGKDSNKYRIRYRNEAYNFRSQLFSFCEVINFIIDEDERELQEGFSAVTQIMRAIEEIYRRRFLYIRNFMRDPPIDVFLRNLKWHLNHEIERWAEIGMEISGGGNKVTISTIHAAKGLEWPVVFIPFLWANRFPLRNSGHGTSFPDKIASRYGTTLEDEKRLWYVSATRARDRLYFYSGSVGKRRNLSQFTYSNIIQSNPRSMIEIHHLNNDGLLSEIISHSSETYFNLAVSDFTLLVECPYHFYLRYVKGISVPVGEEFGAGNIIHKVIERILEEDENADYKQIINEETYLPLAEYPLERNIKNKIEKKIKLLIELGELDDVNVCEIKFKILIENMVITGIIDAIKETREGFTVIDWKSSVNDKFKNRYDNQICTYVGGLRSLGYDIIAGLIYDLNKVIDKNGNYIIEVDVSKEKTDTLLRKAQIALKSLAEETPEFNPSEVNCNICDVSKLCPNSMLP